MNHGIHFLGPPLRRIGQDKAQGTNANSGARKRCSNLLRPCLTLYVGRSAGRLEPQPLRTPASSLGTPSPPSLKSSVIINFLAEFLFFADEKRQYSVTREAFHGGSNWRGNWITPQRRYRTGSHEVCRHDHWLRPDHLIGGRVSRAPERQLSRKNMPHICSSSTASACSPSQEKIIIHLTQIIRRRC